ncbi:hypothetical protein P40081_25485 [Paenibacillus sp. FSL P4-0081]|nr:hypothetical protein P40081_25485 [Paenibacillus sp. FSL P4-0081]
MPLIPVEVGLEGEMRGKGAPDSGGGGPGVGNEGQKCPWFRWKWAWRVNEGQKCPWFRWK